MTQEEHTFLRNLGTTCIQELETERGILASGREEIFGCIFGRDSLITSLELMSAYERDRSQAYILPLVRKILMNLALLQGTDVNIESGEEPGKMIHEYRPDNHDHLTGRAEKPWYVYADGTMRIYDSVDSTPLFLMAIDRYHRVSGDDAALAQLLPHAEAALEWLATYGDTNGDGFIDYRVHPDRTHGGLSTQSWMDSGDSIFHEDGIAPAYPIAPVEVQAYAFAALRTWAERFKKAGNAARGDALELRASDLKKAFNAHFVIMEESAVSLAFAIDGEGRLMTSPRSSMGHVLWAVYRDEDNEPESILEKEMIPLLVHRLMQADLFVPTAGIRTLSLRSRNFEANSYHNGSIWPHDTGLIAEGFENFGFIEEAEKVRNALLNAMLHFKTPVELFTFKDSYGEYSPPGGGGACRKQAWSAAALLAALR